MCTACPNCTDDAKPNHGRTNLHELHSAHLSLSARPVVDHPPDSSLSREAGDQYRASHSPTVLVQCPVSGAHKLHSEQPLASPGWIGLGLVPIYSGKHLRFSPMPDVNRASSVFDSARTSPVTHTKTRSHPFRRHSVALGVPNGVDRDGTTQGRYHLGAFAYAECWFATAPDPSFHSPKARAEGLHQMHQFCALTSSGAFWICLYFILNLALTLFNKIVLVHFPFPYLLTATHALFGTIGCLLLVLNAVFTPSPLSTPQRIQLLAFSVLYTINILVSNISLQLVTIPFHQVVRSATPLFTIIISYGLLGTCVPLKTFLSLVPVIAGVCLATFGDFYFTRWGLMLTLLGTFLAALKTVYTNVLQTDSQRSQLNSSHPRPPSLVEKGYSTEAMRSTSTNTKKRLDSLDLLYRMSPLALIQCILYAVFTGELSDIRHNICLWDCPSQNFFASVGTPRNVIGPKEIAILGLNGILAFALNYVSLTANGKAGALSMTVAANVKQVLTLMLAVVMFDIKVTPLNLLGIILTLLGGACYAAVEYKQKTSSNANQHTSRSNLWQLHR